MRRYKKHQQCARIIPKRLTISPAAI